MRKAPGWDFHALPERPWWHALAACRGVGAGPFFQPVSDRAPGRDRAQRAYLLASRTYCAACPVLAQCRAAGEDEPYGLWGGASPLRHNRQRARGAPVTSVVPASTVAVGALPSKLDRGYLPCPGRPVVCRRPGCLGPATDDVLRLCAGCLAEYQRETAPALTTVGRPGRRWMP